MKTILTAVLVAVFLFACTKNNLTTPSAPSSDAFSNTATASLKAKTRTDLLTAHPWMYNAYYFHYVSQTDKGDPEYIRGASGNIIDLSNTGFTFRKNGTFTEVSDGYRYPGSWYFTDAADTVFVMKFDYGSTNTNTILTLTNSELNYTHASGYHNTIYTELIPAAKQ